MCGLLSLLSDLEIDNSSRCRFNNAFGHLQHRGPDDYQFWESSDHRYRTGHARLSIIDIHSGKQPFIDRKTGTVISYNGELYNYLEIKGQLKNLGHTFSTESDTEVILRSYLEWDTQCLEKFNGMFAFVLYDPQKRQMVAARDPIGIKPLYYSRSEGKLTISSELRGLALAMRKSPSIERESLIEYLTFGYVSSPHTILKECYQLPPGKFLVMNEQGFRIETFTEISDWVFKNNRKHPKNLTEARNELDTVFSDAVKRQLVSDVPVGVFLSGGIDSSLLSFALKEIISNEFKGFDGSYTVDFCEDAYSEGDLAKHVSDWAGLKNHQFNFESQQVMNNWPEMAWASDAPIFDSSFFATHFLCKNTSKSLKVVMGGDGGDELFLGYETFRADHIRQKMDFLSLKKLEKFQKMIPTKFGKVSTSYKIKKFLENAQYSMPRAHLRWRSISNPVVLNFILRQDSLEEVHCTRVETKAESIFKDMENSEEILTKLSVVDLNTWLADDVLVKVDRASMANGLEVRVPFLDLEVVRFALNLPDKLKFSFLEPKRLLKSLLFEKCKNYPRTEKKQGFGIPISEWIASLTSLPIHSGNWRLGEFLDIEKVQAIYQIHSKKVEDFGHLLWAIICLDRWFSDLQKHHLEVANFPTNESIDLST